VEAVVARKVPPMGRVASKIVSVGRCFGVEGDGL
jgi:hypothetical protein